MTAPTTPPDSDPRARVRALLDVALELPPDELATWLDSLQAHEPDVARELRALLGLRERLDAPGFLAAPLPVPPPTRAGERIGPYTLVAPLGEGGMGAVWLAERSDGRFEARVAVKLLHAGLVRASHLERFRREGQVLARLSHPNIARLLDAGVTAGSQPYLVLEYFDGRPIDIACDAASLDVPARLRTFLQVLDAVAHAHSRLVVHRDIKPGNVLVGADGAVKLLDFGIAKLLDTEGIEARDLTRESGRPFTPRFAAPEQVAGESATTATDVYALGMLLYVLLAGEPPDAARRPSPTLPLASVAAAARGDARSARRLEGDLDTIVAKALRTDPAERYATVAAFADDLRRHLNGQIVSARRPTLLYRASRFAAQHRVAVAASAAGLLAIVAFAGIATWQAHEARVQRAAATHQAVLATARGVAAYAIAQAPIRTDVALLLGAEAVKRHAAPETGIGLYTALDAAHQLVRFRPELGVDLRAIALAHDRREAIVVDGEGVVRRVSLADGRVLARRASASRTVLGVYFRAGESLLVVVAENGGEILDATTLAPAANRVAIAPPEPDRVALVDLSPDGELAVAGLYLGHTVIVRDARTGLERSRFDPAPCISLSSLAFAPDGTRLLVGCEDGALVYDLNGRRLRSMASAAVSSIEVSPDGGLGAVVVFEHAPRLVDLATLQPEPVTLELAGGRAYATRFSSDGRYYAIGTDTGRVTVWDVRRKREIANFAALENGIAAVEWLADDFEWVPGQGIVGDARLLVATATTTSEWDLAQRTAAGHAGVDPGLPPVPSYVEPLAPLQGIAWRTTARAALRANTIALEAVSLADGRVVRSLDVHADDVGALTVDPRGSRLFATATRGATAAPQLLVLDARDGRELLRTDWPGVPLARGTDGAAPNLSARFSNDGARIAAVANGQLAIWELATGNRVAIAQVHPLSRAMAWSPDDTRLAITREAAIITLFDTATLKPSGVFERDAAFTIKQMYPSAALGGIVVTSEGGEVYVVDPHAAQLRGEPFRSGGSQLQRSAVSPDGRRLAAWGSDGRVRVWDVATRLPIAPPLRGHPGGRIFNRLWFDANGRLSSYTPGLRIDWNLDLAAAADAACALVGRALTQREWRQFVGSAPYAPACGTPVRH